MNADKWTFLDLITVISFVVSLQNLELNITQEDVQNIASQMDRDLHNHLQEQDKKIDRILGILKENGGIIE